MSNTTRQNVGRLKYLTRPRFDSTGSQVFRVWRIGGLQAETDGVIEEEDENEGGVGGNNLFDQTGGIFAQGQQA